MTKKTGPLKCLSDLKEGDTVYYEEYTTGHCPPERWTLIEKKDFYDTDIDHWNVRYYFDKERLDHDGYVYNASDADSWEYDSELDPSHLSYDEPETWEPRIAKTEPEDYEDR